MPLADVLPKGTERGGLSSFPLNSNFSPRRRGGGNENSRKINDGRGGGKGFYRWLLHLFHRPKAKKERRERKTIPKEKKGGGGERVLLFFSNQSPISKKKKNSTNDKGGEKRYYEPTYLISHGEGGEGRKKDAEFPTGTIPRLCSFVFLPVRAGFPKGKERKRQRKKGGGRIKPKRPTREKKRKGDPFPHTQPKKKGTRKLYASC